jgi:hypothetical protein
MLTTNRVLPSASVTIGQRLHLVRLFSQRVLTLTLYSGLTIDLAERRGRAAIASADDSLPCMSSGLFSTASEPRDNEMSYSMRLQRTFLCP